MVKIKCKELEIEIVAIERDKDHSHMFLNCLPTLSPSDIMQQIKGYTSKILREEFNKLSKMLVYGQEVILSQQQEMYVVKQSKSM